MPTLRDSTLDEVLPLLESWKLYQPDGSSDLFIAAIGFEDRGSACFIDWCKARRGREGVALLVEYPFNKEDNARQETKLLKAADSANIKIVRLKYHRIALYGQALSFLDQQASRSNILLDLSSMASFVFYPLMNAITDTTTQAELKVCYTEATNYFPVEKEWREFREKFKALDLFEQARLFEEYHFQSKGVETVFESPNHPGCNDGQPTTLVVIPNFSVERVQRMLNYGSDNYSVNREESEWLIGMPPDRDKNGWRYEALWDLFNQPHRF
jgi:hypothetical protein